MTDLRQALAQGESTSDSATRSADSADSFCKQELHSLMSVAGRMALELECLLLDTKDLSVVSKWWDTGMESLQAYRDYIWSITHGKEEIIALAQGEREPVAWVCEGFGKEKHNLDYVQDDIDALPVGTPLYTAPPQTEKQEPMAWRNDGFLHHEAKAKGST